MTNNSDNMQGDLAAIERDELVQLAAATAGFVFEKPEFASASNISGIRSGSRVFSRRRDSRTLFAVDNRYGCGREAGAWTGPDEQTVAACRSVLEALNLPAFEVASIDVVAEHGQSAERLGESKTRLNDPHLLRKLARARRVIHDVPVWSSSTMVGLTADGSIGSLEVHWPDIPEPAIKEATRLHELAEKRVAIPDFVGATVESVEAGVLHSPAIGWFMDTVAAIRVVYRGEDPRIGRKPVLYVDRHGERVTPPRSIEEEIPETTERSHYAAGAR